MGARVSREADDSERRAVTRLSADGIPRRPTGEQPRRLRRQRRGLAYRTWSVRGVAVAVGLLMVVTPAPGAMAEPVARDVTRVFGTEEPRMLEPGVGVANFETTGPGGERRFLLAGSTRWDHDGDGIVFIETAGPWLWSSDGGPQLLFPDIPDELYLTPSLYIPAGVADDGTVVGTVGFPEQRASEPWAWTPEGGFEFLPLPDDPAGSGTAVAVARDGQVIAGSVDRRDPRGRVIESQAVTWVDGARVELPDTVQFAETRGMSASGTVVVGAAGPERTALQATRWVDGVQQQLEPVGAESVATFSSADGSFAVGTATMPNNAVVLVRWGRGGDAEILGPPEGMSISSVSAINPDGTAVVGAVADAIPNPFPVIEGDYDPFLWREDLGLTTLPELEPMDEFDFSVASDVSDDGRIVVGALRQKVRNPGDPRNQAIVWIDQQLVTVNDLMREAGERDPDYFAASAISGDGQWVRATGGPRRSEQDTLASIFRLADTRGDVEVTVDLRPGSTDNPINPGSPGLVPLAIVTTPDFDATTVDALSVTFGPDGATEPHGRGHLEDVNGDGALDLLLHFTIRDTGLTPDHSEACLTGSTAAGQTIVGCDRVTVRALPAAAVNRALW